MLDDLKLQLLLLLLLLQLQLQLRRVILAMILRKKDRASRTPPVWDVGMCLALQFSVFVLLLLVALILLQFFAHVWTTYWWFERHLDAMWGFALDHGRAYTAPVWMGEFGAGTPSEYWNHMVRYLSTRDVDWAYWPLTALKLAEGYYDDTGTFIEFGNGPRWENDTFSILGPDEISIRDSWRMLGLQALMPSPSTYVPQSWPCHRDALGANCGG